MFVLNRVLDLGQIIFKRQIGQAPSKILYDMASLWFLLTPEHNPYCPADNSVSNKTCETRCLVKLERLQSEVWTTEAFLSQQISYFVISTQ